MGDRDRRAALRGPARPLVRLVLHQRLRRRGAGALRGAAVLQASRLGWDWPVHSAPGAAACGQARVAVGVRVQCHHAARAAPAQRSAVSHLPDPARRPHYGQQNYFSPVRALLIYRMMLELGSATRPSVCALELPHDSRIAPGCGQHRSRDRRAAAELGRLRGDGRRSRREDALAACPTGMRTRVVDVQDPAVAAGRARAAWTR